MTLSIGTLASRSVADGVTTNLSPIVTSATAAFTGADIGAVVSGAGIPAGSYIISLNSATSANLSQNATATASSLTFTIGGATSLLAGQVLAIVVQLTPDNRIKGASSAIPMPALAGATGAVTWQGQWLIAPPPGLTFASGYVQGIPQAQGEALLAVRATDSGSPPQFVDGLLRVKVV